MSEFRKKRVLIATIPGDVHAGAVAHALREKGHEAVLWCGSDFPSRQEISIDPLAAENATVTISDEGGHIVGDAKYDAVWHRRPSPPIAPEGLHPGDKILVEQEAEAMMESLWHFLGSNAFWVNPRYASERANSKALQLREASRAGFSVPRTLMSNDPERVRNLFQACDGRLVYKLQRPASWRLPDGGLAGAYTAPLEAHHLRDDNIRNCPAIFQERIEKAYELRVTCMGATCVAIKLDSQASRRGRVDWRTAGVDGDLKQEPYTLPQDIERACRELLARLGLVFACIDLCVTPEGEYVFLEANEAGQFLWVEQRVPDLPILDIFCDFLVSADPAFVYDFQKSNNVMPLADFKEEDWLQRQRDAHGEPFCEPAVPD